MSEKTIVTQIMDFLKGMDTKIELSKEENKVEVKLAEMVLDNGTVLVADEFTAGMSVSIFNEEGNVPLPIGEYEMGEDVLVVEEEGVIAEIKPKEVEEKEEETPEEKVEEVVEELKVENVSLTEFNTVIETMQGEIAQLKAMLTKETEDNEAKLAQLSEENLELSKALEEKPDAEVIKHAPVELKAVAPANKRERILQTLRNQKN